jgi:hypothetical protein
LTVIADFQEIVVRPRIPPPDISFDEQDANLFLVDDAQLRADALKHSVLPRLRVMMNEAVSLIREIYGVEALEDSIVSVYPNFRPKRENDLKVLYDSAFVGLGGKRKPQWPGFSRKDKKPVQILPFRAAFMVTEEGVSMLLENVRMHLADKSFERLLRFHIDNEDKLNPLYFSSGMHPIVHWDDSLPLLSPIRDYYEFRIKHKLFDNHFAGHCYHFPVTELQLMEIVTNFAHFFPIYDSYIQIAKGLPPRLDQLIDALNDWLQKAWDEDAVDDESSQPEQQVSDETRRIAALAAESRTRVMPAMRWQVFQRDMWKCVACGRTSHDGAILHVDHIIPQSRGGSSTLDNYQTLCDICNIGKSNRDMTDLRSKRR